MAQLVKCLAAQNYEVLSIDPQHPHRSRSHTPQHCGWGCKERMRGLFRLPEAAFSVPSPVFATCGSQRFFPSNLLHPFVALSQLPTPADTHYYPKSCFYQENKQAASRTTGLLPLLQIKFAAKSHTSPILENSLLPSCLPASIPNGIQRSSPTASFSQFVPLSQTHITAGLS